jgi:UDP-N-acetylglucosamine acyltransferase
MISKLAYVHPDAKLGENVTVEPFAYIADNVEIGEGTWIGPNANVLYGARIGQNCRVFPTAVVSGIPQDLKFRGEDTTAEIGNNTTIREGVTVNRGTAAAGKTVIGNNCLLMALVKVDDWAIISGGSLVHQFSHIGGHVIIGGGGRVRVDVPPFVKADRDPISYMGLNTVGLNRRGFAKERIDEIHNIYRAIFQGGMNISKALEYVEKEFKQSPDRDYIIDFIRNSERGIIKGPR